MNLRRLMSGAAYLTLASVFSRGLALISFPLLTHFLTPGAYGVAALANSLVGLVVILSIAGQDTSLTRNFYDSEGLRPADVEVVFFRFALLSGTVIGLLGGAGWIAYLRLAEIASSPLTAVLVAIGILLSTLAAFSQTSARLHGHFGRLALVMMANGIASLCLVVGTALFWRADEVALLMGLLAGLLTVALLPLPAGLLRPIGIPRQRIWAMMRVGLPLITVAPGYWVVVSSDRWFLEAETSVHELGIYSVAASIAALGQIVTAALTSVWSPELLRNIRGTEVLNQDRLRSGLTGVLWAVIATWFASSLFGEVLIRLMAAESFHSASVYVPWLALGYMIYGVNQFFGFGYLLHRKTGWLPIFWLVGIVTSLALNAILIPGLHAEGAVIAQIAAFATVALLTWGISYRMTPFQPHWVPLVQSFLLFLAVVAMLPRITHNPGGIGDILTRLGLLGAGLTLSALLMQRHIGWMRIFVRAPAKNGTDNSG